MSLFIASLVPLLAAPLLVRLLQSARWAARLLDVFVIVSVGGMILVHILPYAIARGGAVALGATVTGLLLPLASTRLLEGRRQVARSATLVAGLLALGLHAMVDGVALASHGLDQPHGTELGVAVVLHRVPVGLAIWWLARPRLGLRVAIVAVVCMVLATTGGFYGAQQASGLLTGVTGSSLQALVAGSLLHVVVGHRHARAPATPTGRWRVATAAGALLAAALLVGLSLERHDRDARDQGGSCHRAEGVTHPS